MLQGPKIKMLCPVCKEDSNLGTRKIYEAFRGYCCECKRTYVWEPHNSVPIKNVVEKKAPAFCGCMRCGH